jgi:hypothetical protein
MVQNTHIFSKSDSMLLGASTKRSLVDDAAPPSKKQKKQKKQEQTTTVVTTQASTDTTLLSGAVAMLDDSRVFRPAAHLAPSDVSFVSADKKAGFALHSFILKLRSPVFGAMLESLPQAAGGGTTLGGSGEPIELKESGQDLLVFFRSLYANDPYQLLKNSSLRVCKIAHKYGCDELRAASYAVAQRSIKKAKLTVSTTSPSIPELLLLAQETQNPAILTAILTKGVDSFCTARPVQRGLAVTPHRCILHPAEQIPCYYKTPGCRGPAPLDDLARTQLAQLNPATLVKIIESLVATVVDRTPKPRLY